MEPKDVPECGICMGEMSHNPHPDAGNPPTYLEVGTRWVCIPCTVKSRHQWVERAMEAESRVEISFKAGIKEVVEWIDKNFYEVHWNTEKWHAKLKEWGIKDGS